MHLRLVCYLRSVCPVLVNKRNGTLFFNTELKLSLHFCIRHQLVKFHLDFQIFLITQRGQTKGRWRKLPFMEQWICAGWFASIISFHPPNHFMKLDLLSLFYQWENWGSGKLSNLPKILMARKTCITCLTNSKSCVFIYLHVLVPKYLVCFLHTL